MKYGVFISYSLEDVELIEPIIKLVSALRNDLVFQDTRSLIPGQLWESQLFKALSQSKIVIVFWCVHSAASEYVRKEYRAAIDAQKSVLPLLLDDTHLVDELFAYQHIDLRSAVLHETSRRVRERATSGDKPTTEWGNQGSSSYSTGQLQSGRSTSRSDRFDLDEILDEKAHNLK